MLFSFLLNNTFDIGQVFPEDIVDLISRKGHFELVSERRMGFVKKQCEGQFRFISIDAFVMLFRSNVMRRKREIMKIVDVQFAVTIRLYRQNPFIPPATFFIAAAKTAAYGTGCSVRDIDGVQWGNMINKHRPVSCLFRIA